MTVRRISVAALLLGACATVCGQDPLVVRPSAPAARLATIAPADPTAPVLPPLLPVPQQPQVPCKPCLPCQTEYHPGHAYLPEASPDCGAGGCDGECRACRRTWVSLSFFFGWSQDLGEINRGHEFGVAANGGYWFSDAKNFGLDLGILNVHQPYHDIFYGNTNINSPLTVSTGDANLRAELFTHNHVRVDGLLGYRFARLHEHEFINSATGFSSDSDTVNRINAAQIGLVGEYRFGSYFCEVLGKVGVGRNSETISINGLQLTDSAMVVVPEIGVRIGYQLGEGVYGTLGYTLLYMNNVARPGRPDTDFYLNGFTIGLETRF